MKKALYALLILVATAAVGIGAAAAIFYDSRADLEADLEAGYRAARLELYNWGWVKRLDQEEVRYLYQSKCYRQCHGEAAMITAILSPAGWIQVVERMRVKEGVDISGREADLIITYLEERYPTVRSPFDYATRRAVHDVVWRNDLGEGDIYTDVIYVTDEYLRSIAANQLAIEYGLADHHVFIVSFTVHEGVVDLFDLDAKSILKVGGKERTAASPWILRFQTADKHHFEAVVKFRREKEKEGETAATLALIIKDVGGVPKRVYRWRLPLAFPKEIYAKNEESR